MNLQQITAQATACATVAYNGAAFYAGRVWTFGRDYVATPVSRAVLSFFSGGKAMIQTTSSSCWRFVVTHPKTTASFVLVATFIAIIYRDALNRPAAPNNASKPNSNPEGDEGARGANSSISSQPAGAAPAPVAPAPVAAAATPSKPVAPAPVAAAATPSKPVAPAPAAAAVAASVPSIEDLEKAVAEAKHALDKARQQQQNLKDDFSKAQERAKGLNNGELVDQWKAAKKALANYTANNIPEAEKNLNLAEAALKAARSSQQ